MVNEDAALLNRRVTHMTPAALFSRRLQINRQRQHDHRRERPDEIAQLPHGPNVKPFVREAKNCRRPNASFPRRFGWTKFFHASKVNAMKSALIRSRLFPALAAALFLAAPPLASGQNEGNIPMIKMSNVPITTVIENLARQAGMNYLLDPKLFNLPNDASGKVVREPQLTFTWTNMTVESALARVLEENGFVMVHDPFTTVTLITGTNHVAKVVDASLLGSATTNAAPLPNGYIPLIHFSDVPLDVVLKNLLDHDHLKIMLDPKLSDYVDPNDLTFHKFHNAPQVSLRWENLTPKQAIVALCAAYNLVIVKDAATDVVTIKPGD